MNFIRSKDPLDGIIQRPDAVKTWKSLHTDLQQEFVREVGCRLLSFRPGSKVHQRFAMIPNQNELHAG